MKNFILFLARYLLETIISLLLFGTYLVSFLLLHETICLIPGVNKLAIFITLLISWLYKLFLNDNEEVIEKFCNIVWKGK